jgi:hypothetical protein
MNTVQNRVEETLDLQIPQETTEQNLKEIEDVPNCKTSHEIIADRIYSTKQNLQKILRKPNYFKCRDYIFENTKRSVNRIVADKAQIIPKLAGYEKNESYTAYVRRVRGKKVIK